MKDLTKDSLAASDELPTYAEYRPLCVTAIFALLLGLASAVSLINPVLSIVPLAAVATAIVALKQIAAAPQGVSGRSLAISGLCLAAMFLGWGLAQNLYHQSQVARKAREFADDWLRVLATGDLPRAYELHAAREFRQDPHSIQPRVSRVKGESEAELMDFFRDPAVEEFLASGPNVPFRFEEIVQQTRGPLYDRVVLKYTFDGKRGTFPLWITVRRTFSNAYRNADWELNSVRHVPPGE